MAPPSRLCVFARDWLPRSGGGSRQGAKTQRTRREARRLWRQLIFQDHNSLLQRHFHMSLWTEITNTALIGCERKSASFSGAADKLGGLLARLDQNDREGALLGAAALVSLYERAGTLPLKDLPPAPEACEPDDAPRCSEGAAVHLAMMLRGEYGELFPEWLA